MEEIFPRDASLHIQQIITVALVQGANPCEIISLFYFILTMFANRLYRLDWSIHFCWYH